MIEVPVLGPIFKYFCALMILTCHKFCNQSSRSPQLQRSRK